AIAFIGTLTAPPIAGVLVMAGLVMLGLGLSAGAGYQVIARSPRTLSAYRGPSPVIVFGVLFVFANAVGLAMLVLGLGDLETVRGFIVGAATLFVGYLVSVWLFVIRTGALSWRDMGLPRRQGLADLLGAVGLGVAVMVPVTFIALIAGGLTAQLVNARPPEVVPIPTGMGETLAVGAAAAVLVPIGEEVFFRGYALTAWLRDLGPRAALIRSAFFFTLVHIANITAGFEEGARQALVQSAVILPLGFVLGWLFLQRGLMAAVAAHVTYNATILVLASLAQRFVPSPAG
ncbi:MAG TPA: type II CAAX endopeptidase family protein, partial [Candidatus Caenarcaniphilales bacterium]|nr:type II CAAX endopeptidase family protein [Candidatus Caenarcaniphilales bacterium]